MSIKSMHRWSQGAAPEAPEDLTNKAYVDLVVARKADLESPEFIGRPLVPTAPAGTVDTQAANAAFVQEAIASAISNISVSSHTHNQGDVVGLTALLNAKANLASPALTGSPTAPTPETAANDTRIANTAFVKAALGTISIPSGGMTNRVLYEYSTGWSAPKTGVYIFILVGGGGGGGGTGAKGGGGGGAGGVVIHAFLLGQGTYANIVIGGGGAGTLGTGGAGGESYVLVGGVKYSAGGGGAGRAGTSTVYGSGGAAGFPSFCSAAGNTAVDQAGGAGGQNPNPFGVGYGYGGAGGSSPNASGSPGNAGAVGLFY